MFNSKRVSVTIEFADMPGIYDYPKRSPIPQKDHEVFFEGMLGKVESVRHTIEGKVTEIRIKCRKLL